MYKKNTFLISVQYQKNNNKRTERNIVIWYYLSIVMSLAFVADLSIHIISPKERWEREVVEGKRCVIGIGIKYFVLLVKKRKSYSFSVFVLLNLLNFYTLLWNLSMLFESIFISLSLSTTLFLFLLLNLSLFLLSMKDVIPRDYLITLR